MFNRRNKGHPTEGTQYEEPIHMVGNTLIWPPFGDVDFDDYPGVKNLGVLACLDGPAARLNAKLVAGEPIFATGPAEFDHIADPAERIRSISAKIIAQVSLEASQHPISPELA